MKILILFFLLFFSRSGIAQTQDPTMVDTYSAILMPGQKLVFENKSVIFKAFISDSRCPKGVTCIWAGEAKILVELFENGKSIGEEVVVITPAATVKSLFNDFLEKSCFSLSVFALYPYPEINTKIAASDYRLKIGAKKVL